MDKCPKCGNEMFGADEDGFTVSDMQIDSGDVWENYTCNACGFSWNAVYSFSHYEDADTGEIISYKEQS